MQSLMMTYSKAKKKNQSKIEKDNYNTVLTDYGDDEEGEDMDDEEAQPQGNTKMKANQLRSQSEIN